MDNIVRLTKHLIIMRRFHYSGSAALIAAALISSCSTSTTPSTTTVTPSNYNQVNLVSDTTSFGAAFIDSNLANAWGIAFGSTGKPWISANHTGKTTIYDTTGKTVLPAISIGVPGALAGGAPTGVVFNGTTDFGSNKFIFSTEDGTIAAWASGTGAAVVADRSSASAVYKGLAIGVNGGANYLYATDFHNNAVDVFDKNFQKTMSFTDNSIPSGFAPFGIQNINDTLFVTYARQKSDKHDDSSGVGMGYVSMFTTAGTLIGRFASGGNLNSPWGIAASAANFGNASNAILIGNFGDGRINAFDHQGNSLGQLRNSGGSTLSIPGLWALAFNPTAGSDPTKVYFTAGPFDEDHGLFGYVKP